MFRSARVGMVWLILVLALVPIGAASAGPGADADPAPGAADEASELYARGKKLYAEGKFQDAYEAYKAAYGLKRSYDIAANLGNVEIKLSKYAAAVEHLEYALANLPPSLDADKRKEATEKMRGRIAEALNHVGIVELNITPAAADVYVDGTPVGKASDKPKLYLDAGDHSIEARHEGYADATQQVAMAAGQTEAVELSLAADQDGGNGSAEPDASTDDPHVAVIVVGGVLSAAALGVGIALMVMSGSEGDDRQTLVDSLGSTSACSGPAPPAECTEIQDLGDNEETYHSAGLGLLIGGGVLAVGTLLYAVIPRGDEPAAPDAADEQAARITLVPHLGPSAAGLSLQGTF